MAESSTKSKGKLSDVVRKQEAVTPQFQISIKQEAVTPLYNPFSEPDEDSDIVLRVEGTDLHVIKWILSRASPVLRAMFKEKGSKVVNLPEKKVKDFITFLCEIYPDLDSQLTSDNVLQILKLANEYQCNTIISRVDDALFIALNNKKLSSLDPSVLKSISGIPKLQQARSYCIKEFQYLRSSTFAEKDFPKLDDTFLSEIFQKRLDIIEKCMDDVVPAFKFLLWQVYSAIKLTNKKYHICNEHQQKDNFLFVSKCDKCKDLFRDILRGYFLMSTEDQFGERRLVFQTTSFGTKDSLRPIIGIPFKTHSDANCKDNGKGWKYMVKEVGDLIDEMSRLNL